MIDWPDSLTTTFGHEVGCGAEMNPASQARQLTIDGESYQSYISCAHTSSHGGAQVKSTLLACLLLAAFLPANAQSMSDKEADEVWFKLQIMTSGENDTARVAHLKSHGVTDDGARMLVAHVARGNVAVQEVSASIVGLICDDQ